MPRSKNTKKNTQRLNRLKKNAKRLAAYSAAAAATVITTGDRSAKANEVIWDIADITSTGVDPSRGVFFNMNNGSTFGAVNGPATAPGYNFYNFTTGLMRLHPGDNGYIYGPAYAVLPASGLGFVGTGAGTGTGLNVTRLAVGAPVAAADNFVVNGPYFSNFYAFLGNNWAVGETGVAGIRFKLGANTHLGWAQITNVDGAQWTLHGFGYNDTPGTASVSVDTVNPIPEPSSLMLCALGAAGLGMRRRRKKAA